MRRPMPGPRPLVLLALTFACARPATNAAQPPANEPPPPAESSEPAPNEAGAPTSNVCWCCNAEGEATADGSSTLLGCDTMAGAAGEQLYADCTKPVRGCGEDIACQRSAEGWDCTLPASTAQ